MTNFELLLIFKLLPDLSNVKSNLVLILDKNWSYLYILLIVLDFVFVCVLSVLILGS